MISQNCGTDTNSLRDVQGCMQERFYHFLTSLDAIDDQEMQTKSSGLKHSTLKLCFEFVPDKGFSHQLVTGMLPNMFSDTDFLSQSNIEFMLIKNHQHVCTNTPTVQICLVFRSSTLRTRIDKRFKEFEEDLRRLNMQANQSMGVESEFTEDNFFQLRQVDFKMGGITKHNFIQRCYDQVTKLNDILFFYHYVEEVSQPGYSFGQPKDDSEDTVKYSQYGQHSTSKRQGPFQGTERFKKCLLIEFQRQCWIHAGKMIKSRLMCNDSVKQDKIHQKSQNINNDWEIWKRTKDYTCMIHCMAITAINNCRQQGVVPAEIDDQDNLKDILERWESLFSQTLCDHIAKLTQDVVHPHPVLSAVRSFILYRAPAVEDGMHVDDLIGNIIFDPRSFGVGYAVPFLQAVNFISQLVYIKDCFRKSDHQNLFLIGVPGSGKSKLLSTIIDLFGGYSWQKKATNFQSQLLAEKSFGVVDECDVDQLITEKNGSNEWKQRLDPEQTTYIDKKGVQGMNCTKYFPFVLASNRTAQWFGSALKEEFKRRLTFIDFHVSIQEWQHQFASDPLGNPMFFKLREVSQRTQSLMIGNLILVMPLFFPCEFTSNENPYLLDDKLVDHVIKILISNRYNTFLSLLFTQHRMTHMKNAMKIYGAIHNEPHACSHLKFSQKFVRAGGYEETCSAFFPQQDAKLTSDELAQIQVKPHHYIKRHYQDLGKEKDSDVPIFETTVDLYNLIKELPWSQFRAAVVCRLKLITDREPVKHSDQDQDQTAHTDEGKTDQLEYLDPPGSALKQSYPRNIGRKRCVLERDAEEEKRQSDREYWTPKKESK